MMVMGHVRSGLTQHAASLSRWNHMEPENNKRSKKSVSYCTYKSTRQQICEIKAEEFQSWHMWKASYSRWDSL